VNDWRKLVAIGKLGKSTKSGPKIASSPTNSLFTVTGGLTSSTLLEATLMEEYFT
jgi:hypothetical protein